MLPVFHALSADAGTLSHIGLCEAEQHASAAQLKAGNSNRQHGDERRLGDWFGQDNVGFPLRVSAGRPPPLPNAPLPLLGFPQRLHELFRGNVMEIKH